MVYRIWVIKEDDMPNCLRGSRDLDYLHLTEDEITFLDQNLPSYHAMGGHTDMAGLCNELGMDIQRKVAVIPNTIYRNKEPSLGEEVTRKLRDLQKTCDLLSIRFNPDVVRGKTSVETLFNISNYYMGILGDFPEKEFGSGVIERSGDRRLKPYIEEIRRLYGDDIAIEVFGSFWSSDNNDVDARVYRNEFSVDDYNILERSDVFYVDGIPLGPQVMPRDIGRKLRGYNLDAGIETENKRIVFGDIDLPILKEDDVKTLLMIQIGDYILRTREETYMEWIRENLLPGTTINKIRGRLKTPHLIYKWLKHFYDSIPEPPPKTDISRMGEADVLEEMIRVNVYYSQLAQRLKEPI